MVGREQGSLSYSCFKQNAFNMLEMGINRKQVKCYLTSHRVKGRQAVAMLC